jgi:hypothetical protein
LGAGVDSKSSKRRSWAAATAESESVVRRKKRA